MAAECCSSCEYQRTVGYPSTSWASCLICQPYCNICTFYLFINKDFIRHKTPDSCRTPFSLNVHRIRSSPTSLPSRFRFDYSGLRLYLQSDRDKTLHVDHMNPLFPCDHGAATHWCIMHYTGRGTLCNKKLSYRWQTARCCFVKLLRYRRTFD